MLILLDTNIWLNELGLNTKLGSAVRFYMLHRDAKLVLPEVVRLETQRHLTKDFREAVGGIRSAHSRLLSVFGKLKDVVLPDDASIVAKVESVFKETGVEIIEVPFSLESAKSSLLKTIDGIPPSGPKNQQFKDGVVWADCCALLEKDDVVFVTQDAAFYRDKKYENGLAENLKAEIKKKPFNFRILRSLEILLEELKLDVTISDSDLMVAAYDSGKEAIHRMLDTTQFQLGNKYEVKSSLFATETPQKLYVSFEILRECIDQTEEDRTEAVLRIKGNASFNSTTSAFDDVELSKMELSFTRPDGTNHRNTTAFMRAGVALLGHPSISHSVKFPLGSIAK